MCFDKNISENKDGKKNEGSYLSCVTNGEFHFRATTFYLLSPLSLEGLGSLNSLPSRNLCEVENIN